ncbi:Wall-associated kinase family protein [Rhynchospora pubera]|uniref:Wall-associated kinase family protein n=1 Tax=Rhynchospora pubera TaxID=906938 RepID=A0AAV8CLH6_9POAL|nr:Wall-associated kinase family protein [Rhynchospora pubera]
MGAIILIIQLFLLILPSLTKVVESANTTLPGCRDSCGKVPIPYPFGIGPNCSMSEAFELSCSTTNLTTIPYRYSALIMNISLSLGQARVGMPISSKCYNITTKLYNESTWEADLKDTPYRFNHEKNKFVVIGCNTLGYLSFTVNQNDSYWGGCVSGCDRLESLSDESCSGIGCCQTSIPKGTSYILFEFVDFRNPKVYSFNPCSYAMLTGEDEFVFNTSYITAQQLLDQNTTIVIDWFIGNTTCDSAQTNKSSYACKSDYSICLNSSSGPGYLCNCIDGYEGNPYLQGGCQDIDECTNRNACFKDEKCHNLPGSYKCSCPFGKRNKHNDERDCELNLSLFIGSCVSIVILSFLGFGAYVVHERRKLSKVKEKYFQEYGGWTLLKKIQSDQGFGFTIFTRRQVELATNNFDSANIIGHGGQGTVYRGTFRDQMVAIKKCKIVDESKKKEFGKEMIILSQINHKNIVKLLGCCLEVEVPILVYEFIPNGTLFNYIRGKNKGSRISLSLRLMIAHESADALAYLHFSASPPIFHGDVKSANILLDENYMAKVSDFGASILVPSDKEQFVTLVQGTCGYLDPEYLQTCQLTDKSDVYSFGVVLLELLTSKPAIAFDVLEEERSLSSRFLVAMKEKKMHDLLDDEIKGDDLEVIMEVAELAKECLNMKADERPTMKEIAQELDRIRKLKQHPWGQEYNSDEMEPLFGEISHDTGCFGRDKEAEVSIAFGR